MDGTDPLVTADWLLSARSARDLRIVDARWIAPFLNTGVTGRAMYQSAHITDAVYFDIDDIADTTTDLPHMLPDAIKFSSRLRKLGIGDGHRIVVYDQNRFFASARAWWMLRTMGVRDVFVLDGGLDAWVAAGGDTESLAPVSIERHFTARKRADLVKTVDEIEVIAAAGSHLIVDARPSGRFDGTAPEPRANLASGHIPGSVNLPGPDLINEDGTMKSAASLKKLLPASHKPIITTCGSGVTAAVTALAYARCGNFDVSVFDGSWSEWADGGHRPVSTGSGT